MADFLVFPMAELSLTAFSPAIFHQEQPLLGPPKDVLGFLPSPGRRQNIYDSRCAGLQIGTLHPEQSWKFSSSISDSQLFTHMPVIKKPVLIDMQDTCPDSMLFSFGVAEQCTRRDNILKSLAYSSNMTDGDDLNISLISELVGLQTVAVDMCPWSQVPMDDELCLNGIGADGTQKIIHPQKQLYAPQPLLNFVGNLSHSSSITAHPNGHVLFRGSAVEMKNLLSIFAEFNLDKGLSNGSRKAMVVPYFTRRRGGHTRTYAQPSSSSFETQTAEPSKRAEKSKSQQKKNGNRDPNSERLNMNYLYACDCLIDVYVDKTGDRKMILALKDAAPELTHLLTQISSWIGGTGLAVFVILACKAMRGNAVLFTHAKLLNVTFGGGLFWLFLALYKLKDTIDRLSSTRAKRPSEDKEVANKVRTSVNEILFRSAVLVAVGLLCL